MEKPTSLLITTLKLRSGSGGSRGEITNSLLHQTPPQACSPPILLDIIFLLQTRNWANLWDDELKRATPLTSKISMTRMVTYKIYNIDICHIYHLHTIQQLFSVSICLDSKNPWKWKWSNEVEKVKWAWSDMKSYKKLNAIAETAKFTVFTMYGRELPAEKAYFWWKLVKRNRIFDHYLH